MSTLDLTQSDVGRLIEAVALDWFSAFADNLERSDVDALLLLFLPDGWFRDLLTFTWDLRTRHGQDEIKLYLAEGFKKRNISNVQMDKRDGMQPKTYVLADGRHVIEFGFIFETRSALGRGFIRLVPEDEEKSIWKALAVMMMIDDWKGHEEVAHESGIYDNHNISWEEIQKQRRLEIERDPQVLIVGAGQGGLQQAARNRQLGLRTLVIERDARIGDVWRKRYPTLALHTTKKHHSFLYQPFPSNWPTFTPKGRLAFWFEQYAETNDLVVWTSSTLEPGSAYDYASKRWNITVNQEGVRFHLRPAHLVIATGFLGEPNIPEIPGRHKFLGEVFHSDKYQGGLPFKDKQVVVVGACNSAADICQDLVFRGASSVTMIQRSSTCVVSQKAVNKRLAISFPEEVPVEISDFKFASMPFLLRRELSRESQKWVKEEDHEMLDGLGRAGFHVNDGMDGTGQHALFYERGGGYFLDVGCAPLIINGSVKIKQGVEVGCYSPSGIVLTNGEELLADVVIFATGWHNARDKLKAMLGDDIVDQTKQIWGLDAEGEINGVYKYTGYPGLWYATSDFAHARPFSKVLGLFIKAIEIGLVSFEELEVDERARI